MAGEVATRIGQRMRQRRKEMGLRQRDVAARIDDDAVTNQHVSNWERGINKPSDRYLSKIAKALDRDVSYFLAPPVGQSTPDLMGTFNGDQSDGMQLDRIEAKLNVIIDKLGLSREDAGAAFEAELREVAAEAAERRQRPEPGSAAA